MNGMIKYLCSISRDGIRHKKINGKISSSFFSNFIKDRAIYPAKIMNAYSHIYWW
jgi:hypothetical protein